VLPFFRVLNVHNEAMRALPGPRGLELSHNEAKSLISSSVFNVIHDAAMRPPVGPVVKTSSPGLTVLSEREASFRHLSSVLTVLNGRLRELCPSLAQRPDRTVQN